MDDIKFTAIEEVLTCLKENKFGEASERIKAFGKELAKYEESVRLILERQAKAVDVLVLASKQTNDLLVEVKPKTTGEQADATTMWLERFHTMCEELGTDDFEQVDEGLVYLENKYIMFKRETLISHMALHYGKLPMRHHFDIARALLGAESSSVARKNYRSRVWVVKANHSVEYINENF